MKIAYRFIYCIGVIAVLASFGESQQKMRTVEHEKYKTKNEPITVSYELGDKPFLKDDKIAADPEWLKNLTLNVKNTSQKTIIYFYIELVIEKQGKMENNQVLIVRFPTSTEPVLDVVGNPTGEYKRPVLKSGESVKMKISEDQSRVLEDLKKQEVEDIDLVSLDIRYVYYEDGTRWMVGHEVRQDPDDKDKWIPVGVEPRKPILSERFSRWLKSFALINDSSHSFTQMAFIFPATVFFFRRK